jgi:hypothetical protein
MRDHMSVLRIRGVNDFEVCNTMGGIVPTHAHDDHPLITVIEPDDVLEHLAFCAVPILHQAGGSTP